MQSFALLSALLCRAQTASVFPFCPLQLQKSSAHQNSIIFLLLRRNSILRIRLEKLKASEAKKCFDLIRCIAGGRLDKSCFHIRCFPLNPDKTLVRRRKVIIGEDTKPIKKNLNFLDKICSAQITAGSFGSKMTDFPFAIV